MLAFVAVPTSLHRLSFGIHPHLNAGIHPHLNALEVWRVPHGHWGATRCAHAYVLTAHGASVAVRHAPTSAVDGHLNRVHMSENRRDGTTFNADWSEPPLFCQGSSC